jgi:ABC-type multidrug transport system ATPase subunit
VANVARNIARSGKLVICTIHQPSRMVLEAFDSMLLMKRGGNTVYFGPIGPSSRELVGYFESNGASKFPFEANPAEVMLEVIRISRPTSELHFLSTTSFIVLVLLSSK